MTADAGTLLAPYKDLIFLKIFYTARFNLLRVNLGHNSLLTLQLNIIIG